jgi:hypothetical protein
VAVCQRPGASIAAVATLHRWIKEHRLSGSRRLTAQPSPHSPGLPAFVPLPMPAPYPSPYRDPDLSSPPSKAPRPSDWNCVAERSCWP